MAIEVEVQNACGCASVPPDDDFRTWTAAALQDRPEGIVLVRIVDRKESRQLNRRYRGRDRSTNVLSFPAELPEEVGLPLLGDVVICAPLVGEEATAQNKRESDHWAHLTVHGVLHLLGYDHQDEREASEMERLEIALLESLGIPNPYRF